MRKFYRLCSLVLILAILCSFLSGCLSGTGSRTPEAVAERAITSLFRMDGADLMDCILPSLSAIYKASANFAQQLTGEDPEKQLVNDFLEDLSNHYEIGQRPDNYYVIVFECGGIL